MAWSQLTKSTYLVRSVCGLCAIWIVAIHLTGVIVCVPACFQMSLAPD